VSGDEKYFAAHRRGDRNVYNSALQEYSGDNALGRCLLINGLLKRRTGREISATWKSQSACHNGAAGPTSLESAVSSQIAESEFRWRMSIPASWTRWTKARRVLRGRVTRDRKRNTHSWTFFRLHWLYSSPAVHDQYIRGPIWMLARPA